MWTLFIILHILVGLALVGIVLLQTGKGAEMGAAFGGSSQTLFGSAGPGTFLSKLTTAAAVIFMCTSLTLAYMSSGQSRGGSVMTGAGRHVSRPAPVPGRPMGPTSPSTNQPAPQPQGKAAPAAPATPSAMPPSAPPQHK